MTNTNRPLRVFLCHSSNDKPAVRELYQKLLDETWIEPWLDEEELYPGDDWDLVIQKAVEESDVVLVCLSNGSINKRGYIQKELRFALDIALEIPEEEIFIIPLRLEECMPPRSLRDWQYADYFEGQRERGFQRLLVSLQKRAESLEINVDKKTSQKDKADIIDQLEILIEQGQHIVRPNNIDYKIIRNKITLSNGMEFMHIPAGKFLMGSNNGDDDEKPQHTVDIPYDYWMARFPVTNEQYNQFKKKRFGKGKEKHPVVNLTWNQASAYCKWLDQILNSEFRVPYLQLRLPTEAEWEKAARRKNGREYPWGNGFYKNKCNTEEGGKGATTPVGLYSPQGDSPYGCADMSGNVWEWTHSLIKAYPYNLDDGREDEKASVSHVLRGGSFFGDSSFARCASRLTYRIGGLLEFTGFRVVASLPIPK